MPLPTQTNGPPGPVNGTLRIFAIAAKCEDQRFGSIQIGSLENSARVVQHVVKQLLVIVRNALKYLAIVPLHDGPTGKVWRIVAVLLLILADRILDRVDLHSNCGRPGTLPDPTNPDRRHRGEDTDDHDHGQDFD